MVQSLVFEQARGIIPNLKIVSEELVSLPTINELALGEVLIVDPIDGTENYTSGLPEWGVSLCLYRDGIHLESLLLCPELNLKVQSGELIQRYQSRIAGISSSLSKEDILKLEPGFEYRIIGCCVLNMINVVRGAYATFENPKGARVWDIIGGLNLAREQGLNVTVNGVPYAGELLNPEEKFTFKIRAAGV